MVEQKQVFISYKRNIEPDERIALEVFTRLSKHHSVFIDQTMGIGTKWAKEIEEEIHRADYFISFVSEYSVKSEMVVAEIETAYRLNKQYGSPTILPIRLKYIEPLVYPLSAYLNPINYATWEKDSDTDDLVQQLELAISGQQISFPKVPKMKMVESKSAEDKIKHLINLGEYAKALHECDDILLNDPENLILNILIVIATLRGRGVDKLHPDTVIKLEAYLRKTFVSPKIQPTALAILGIIKYDYYEVHGLYDKGFSFQDIKRKLKEFDPYSIDMNLVRQIKASEGALRSLDLI